MTSDPQTESAWHELRSQYGGDLRFEDNVRPLRYVFDSQGRMVAPVMVAMIRAFDTVLFVPQCRDGAMEVLVTLREIDEQEDGAAVDRWRIHHGSPDDVSWAHLEVDCVKHDGLVIDGVAFLRPNPMAAEEAAICRHMNTEHTDALRDLALRHADLCIEQPVMVGIDPDGIDIRGQFEVVRIRAAEPMTSEADARRILRAMTSDAPTKELSDG